MSLARDLHREGDCDSWSCHYCLMEEDREIARREAEAAEDTPDDDE